MSTNNEPNNTHQIQIKYQSCDLATAMKLLDLMKQKNLDEFVTTLQSTIFNINHYYEAPENGTLLEIACRSYGYSDFVKVLIVYGAGGISKNTPLHKGQINQVENFNSDLSQLDDTSLTSTSYEESGNQQTYLQYACNLGLVGVVEDLLKMGFDPNEHYPNCTETPIKIAARNGYHEIVSMLVNSPGISLQWHDNFKPALESVLDYIFGQDNVTSTGNSAIDKERDYYKCLECILKKIFHESLLWGIPKPKRKLTPAAMN